MSSRPSKEPEMPPRFNARAMVGAAFAMLVPMAIMSVLGIIMVSRFVTKQRDQLGIPQLVWIGFACAAISFAIGVWVLLRRPRCSGEPSQSGPPAGAIGRIFLGSALAVVVPLFVIGAVFPVLAPPVLAG